MGASMEFQERYQSLRSEHSSPIGVHLDDLISHEAFPVMRGDSQLNNSSLLSAVAEDRVLATESLDNYKDTMSPDGYVRGFSSAVKALTSDGDVNGASSLPPSSSAITEMKKVSSWKAEMMAAEAADTAASVEDYGEAYTSGSEVTVSESSYTSDDYSDHETDSLADFEVPIESLEFGKCIGEGTFGTVYKGNWHGKVAIKVLKVDNPTEAQLSTFRNEAAVLMACRHDNILLFMGACTIPPKLCLITEWCEGDTLFKRLYDDDQQPLTKVDVCSVAYECAVGLSYLHAKQIVHRDLKSANIFLVSQCNNGIATYSVRIGDFGLAAAKSNVGQSGDTTSTPVGSILWMAPEMVRRKPDEDLDFYFSDVYSYGIVMYEILAAELPYKGLIPDQILVMVGMGLIAPAWETARKDICSEMLELSIECTNRDPTRRPSFRTISLRMGEFMDQAIKQSQNDPETHLSGRTVSGNLYGKNGSPPTPGRVQRTWLSHVDTALANTGMGSGGVPESPRVIVNSATPNSLTSAKNLSLSPRPLINRSQSNRASTSTSLYTGLDIGSPRSRARSGSEHGSRTPNGVLEFSRRNSGRASSPLKRVDSINKLNDIAEPGDTTSSSSKDGLLVVKRTSASGLGVHGIHGNRRDDDSDSDAGGESGLSGGRGMGVLHSSSLSGNGTSGSALFGFAKRASSGGVTDRPKSTSFAGGYPTSVFDFGRRASGPGGANAVKREEESSGNSSINSGQSNATGVGPGSSAASAKTAAMGTPLSTFDFTRRNKEEGTGHSTGTGTSTSTIEHTITSTSTDTDTGANTSTDTIKNADSHARAESAAEVKGFVYPTSAFDFSRRGDGERSHTATVAQKSAVATDKLTGTGGGQSDSLPLGKGLPQTAPIGNWPRAKSTGSNLRLDLPASDFDFSVQEHEATAPVRSASGTFYDQSSTFFSRSGLLTAGIETPAHTATTGSGGSSRSSSGATRQVGSVRYPTSTFDFSRRDKAAGTTTNAAPGSGSHADVRPEEGGDKQKSHDSFRKFGSLAYPTSTFDFSRGKEMESPISEEKPRGTGVPVSTGGNSGTYTLRGVDIPTSTFDFSRSKPHTNAEEHGSIATTESAGADFVAMAIKSPKLARPASAGGAPVSSFDSSCRTSGKKKLASESFKRFSVGQGAVGAGTSTSTREPVSHSGSGASGQLSPRSRPISETGSAGSGAVSANITSKTVLRERSNSRTSFTSLRNSISGLGRHSHSHGHKDKESKKRKDKDKEGTSNNSTGTVGGEESGISTESLQWIPSQQEIKAALQKGTSRVSAPSFVPTQKDIQNALYKGNSRVRLLSTGALAGLASNTETGTGTSCASEDLESDDYDYRADGKGNMEPGTEFREDLRSFPSGSGGRLNLNVRKTGSVGSVSMSKQSSNARLVMGRDRDRSHSLSRNNTPSHSSSATVNRSNSTFAGGTNPYTDAQNQDDYCGINSDSSMQAHGYAQRLKQTPTHTPADNGSNNPNETSGNTASSTTHTPGYAHAHAYQHVPNSYTIKTRANVNQSPVVIEKTINSPSLMTSLGVGTVASVARQPLFDFTPQETSPRILTPDIDEHDYDYDHNNHHKTNAYAKHNYYMRANSNDGAGNNSGDYEHPLSNMKDSTGSFALARKSSGNRGAGATLGASAGSGEKGAYGSGTFDLHTNGSTARLGLRDVPHQLDRSRAGSTHESRRYDAGSQRFGLNDTGDQSERGHSHKPLQGSRSAEMPYSMTGLLWEDTVLAGGAGKRDDGDNEMFDYTKPDSVKAHRRHSQLSDKGPPRRRHSNHGLTPGKHLQLANGEVTPLELAEKRGRTLGSTSVFMDVSSSSESSDVDDRRSGTKSDTGVASSLSRDKEFIAMATAVVGNTPGKKRVVSRKRGSVADVQNRMASVSEAERERSVSRSTTPVNELGAVETKNKGIQVSRQISGHLAPQLESRDGRSQGHSYMYDHKSDTEYTGRSRSHMQDNRSAQKHALPQNLQAGIRSQASSNTLTAMGSGVMRDREFSFDLDGFSAVQDSPVLTNLEAVTDADHSSTNLAGTYTHSPLIAKSASSTFDMGERGNLEQDGSDCSTENPLFRGVSPEPSPTWYP
ncbi:TKL/RAF/RAF protein kinase [Sphaeroforma arctica JP610]|uniref:non-specific serine/threonine protein kinase n=1 Tax=Sphaeroforma arctica JP610 TaxID=667725 RepID=A0A0L0FRD7_9EUKA|nr:TKL/RAF/RAF protein kinase [Sphaeroforma arctica JP610]KNC79387.1 TKL/RAF/RAF protein kinase [Sphaeroforma arctica JP610]|eukprot:XP_014153289.1 TKL/RAF/RAF protein kinase [Sphaeroforma arctica JP610]